MARESGGLIVGALTIVETFNTFLLELYIIIYKCVCLCVQACVCLYVTIMLNENENRVNS